MILEMEEQIQHQQKQLKEQYHQERKRINAEWDEKIKILITESAQKDK